MKNDFNRVAPYYDLLKGLVFGNAVDKAAFHFLHRIPEHSSILVVGGGTGKILHYLPHVCEVHYVEKSVRMIRKTGRRSLPERSMEVRLINKDFLEFRTDRRFDFILCPFLLDLFAESHLKCLLDKISSLLKADGKLLVADFQPASGQSWKSVLLTLLHLFFDVTANLESTKLHPIHEIILNHGFKEAERKFFYFNMIFSRIYHF